MNVKLIKTRPLVVAGLCAAFVTAAFGASFQLGGPDDSLSRFGGDGYVYFHENTPGSSKSLAPFRVTDPKGLSEAAYAAYSSEDPEWQPKVVVDRSTLAADPIPRITSPAQEKAFFRVEDKFLQSESSR